MGHKDTFTLFIHLPIIRASHRYDGSTNKWKAQIDKVIGFRVTLVHIDKRTT